MNLNFKWQRNSIDIFPKKMYKWPTVTWKDAQQALLIIREMQIKTKMRYDLTSVRIGTIKITDKWGCGERESTIGRNANQYSHYGKHYEGFSKNLKTSNPTFGYISEGNKVTISKIYWHPMFLEVWFTKAKSRKIPSVQ